MGRLPERHPGSDEDTVAVKDTGYGHGRAAQDREFVVVPNVSCFLAIWRCTHFFTAPYR